ncbi:MAG: hypothetical protein A2X13_01045 [Bacteroidetes bacterium GWC2_33_15]|nr:MAG: hypothetical protein A2X10_00140 [Bacteroidetes bacterium GWA2_33_15]OFX49948.1 MAG: hypothetical protein A2X13_01045 [Bacteroidetes bacterium GWC2_33_15]OFX64204.1 MAG: hypothetical protein A2X15_15115 [Bacteroidetes bacterium GWB2_32_14]OFX69616.1 MAG: hypothetical protein A2X14_15415 [Bacteroidetes bacterium GWD2_33_33]
MFVIASMYSCNSPGGRQSDKMDMDSYEMNEAVAPITRSMAAPSSPMQKPAEFSIEKKIIKDARVGIEVSDYYVFRINLDSLIVIYGGYTSNDNLYNNDEAINCDIAIRIPEKNFEKFITILEKGSEKILYKNISARDVTEEFIDIEARLKNKKDVEKRYSELLSRAKTIKDILEIEEKLRVIREEIESVEGRLNYLKSQVSYSTIDLMITQKLDFKYQPSKEKNFFQLLIKSLDKGWKVFLQFTLFVFKLWPFIILILIVIYGIRWYRIKRKKKKEKK